MPSTRPQEGSCVHLGTHQWVPPSGASRVLSGVVSPLPTSPRGALKVTWDGKVTLKLYLLCGYLSLLFGGCLFEKNLLVTGVSPPPWAWLAHSRHLI